MVLVRPLLARAAHRLGADAAGASLVAGLGLRLWALGSIDGNKKCKLVNWARTATCAILSIAGSAAVPGGLLRSGGIARPPPRALRCDLPGLYCRDAAEERLWPSNTVPRWNALPPRLRAAGSQRSGATRAPGCVSHPGRCAKSAPCSFCCCSLGLSRLIHLDRAAHQLPAWFI